MQLLLKALTSVGRSFLRRTILKLIESRHEVELLSKANSNSALDGDEFDVAEKPYKPAACQYIITQSTEESPPNRMHYTFWHYTQRYKLN